MNCQEITELLHGFVDNELDPVRSLEIEQHLKGCEVCQRHYRQQQNLRKLIAGSSLYEDAPRRLRERVHAAVRQAAQAEAPRSRWHWDLRWSRMLVPAAAAGLVLLLALPWLAQPSAQSRLAKELVSDHVRSLLPGHLTDVASTDQHTVKPWFNGKITFSPPVPDPAAEGFPLVGGRLDVLQEQPVAALVYQRRKHFINLFVWPSTHRSNSKEQALAQRGFNLVHWNKDGMDFWAVSDLNQGELQQFARLVGAVSAK